MAGAAVIGGSTIGFAIENLLLESRIPYVRSFDVLVQYMVILAVSDGFTADQLFDEVKGTHCFQSITREEFSCFAGIRFNTCRKLMSC